MSWAQNRRFFILLVLGAIFVVLAAITLVATLYETPSCSDGKQNQNEEGIDCGGPCTYLCTALMQPPTVLYTQVLSTGNGRTGVIASIENKNTNAAAKAVPYVITLYGEDLSVVAKSTGQVDLPAGANVPIYIPDIVTENKTVTSAFLTLQPAQVNWYRLLTNPRSLPAVANIKMTGTAAAPRAEAVLSNTTVADMTNVRAVIVVIGNNNIVIGASSTVVPIIPAGGQAIASFTWNDPFRSVPLSFKVVPIIPLP